MFKIVVRDWAVQQYHLLIRVGRITRDRQQLNKRLTIIRGAETVILVVNLRTYLA